MKILHTADWHLGAKLEGRDRILEQTKIVQDIAKIADDYDVSVVIIAGDIYHNSTPSAMAEDLFYSAIEKLSDNGNRLVFVLNGNHDDAERLGACKPLAEKHNIIVATNLDSVDITRTKVDARVRITDAGKGYIRLKAGEEECVLAYLPFFGEQKCKELVLKDISYNDCIRELSNIGASHFSSEAFNVFVSHLFVAGAKLGEGDEIKVGDVMAVNPINLPAKAHYIALGHLHRIQKVRENIFYSGSATELRFKDSVPCVIVAEGNKSGLISVKEVPIKSACNLVKIKVKNMAQAYKELSFTNENELVELTFVQDNPLRASEIKELKKLFSNLVSVRLELTIATDEIKEVKSRRNLNDKDLFIDFYKHTVGIEPDKRLVEMFLEIRGKVDVTN